MVQPIRIDPDASEAPYEQVRRHIAHAAATGELAAGHKLPTVRALAAELHLAPNTVARAYKELEADQVVQTYGRKGTFVASAKQESASALEAAAAFVAVVRRDGLSLDESIRLISDHWH